MKVLIVGAGPAGLCVAFWLSRLRAKPEITVLESAPELRTSGLQIDLRSHGITVLRRMGLEAPFREKMAPEQGAEIVDGSGRRRAYFPANSTDGKGKDIQAFTTEWEIMRGDFVRMLIEAIGPLESSNVRYIFGAKIISLHNEKERVHVRLSDSSTTHYDLVIGADGVNSQVRRLTLPLNTADPRYPVANMITAYFTIPSPIPTGQTPSFNATGYIATNKRGIMTRRSNIESEQIYIGGKSSPSLLANVKRGDVLAEKAALADWFKGAGWRSDEVVAKMMDADDFYCERIAVVKILEGGWSPAGNVVLVGDAAYCPSVMTGMGTSCAVVGAYVLVGELASGLEDGAEGIERALKRYEKHFRPFMEKVQEGVLESEWDFMPEGRIGVGLFNLVAGLVSFFKINVAKWMIKEDIKGWELPKYEALMLNDGNACSHG